MGEYTLSGNASIGLSSPVEFAASVNSVKNREIFYSTPSTVAENNLIPTPSCNAMQDETVEKPSLNITNINVDDANRTQTALPGDKAGQLNVKECDNLNTSVIGNGLGDKLSEPIAPSSSNQNIKTSGLQLGNVFSVSEASSNILTSSTSSSSTNALWSNSIEDSYMHNVQPNVNGTGLTFQNFVSYNNNVSQANQATGRRAITASHNFPHTMGRQQGPSNHHIYKGYSAWPNPQQSSWSSGATASWNRGRSVPNLNPMQQISGLVNRKPSPTFSHQHSNMVISPVKFRRSTSYPGKGIFTQPPTFEITNMDDNRELLPYQVTIPRVSSYISGSPSGF